MPKKRVLLLCSQDLFGDSMESLLRRAKDIELIGPWNMDEGAPPRIPEADPDVVVIADKDPRNKNAVQIATAILEKYPDLSVICTGLTQKIFRVFSTQTLPARGMDLLEAIHSLPAQGLNFNEADRKFSEINSDHNIKQTQRSGL